MKKLIALVLALAMVFTLGLAFAAPQATGEGGTGSVTVSNAHSGQTYTLYKIFDADITMNAAGTEIAAINYKLPAGKNSLGDGTTWFHMSDDGKYVLANTGLTRDWAKNAAACAWARNFGTRVGTAIEAASDNDANVSWTELTDGYYFVDSTLGAFVSIDTTRPAATVVDKNNPPEIDKKITGVKDSDGNADGSVFNRADGSVDEVAIAQVGDTVSYSVKVTVKPGAENYVVSDTMTHLTLVADSVKVDGTAYGTSTKVNNADGTSTSVTNGATSFTIEFAQSYLNTITADTDVVITYDAILGADAVVASAANPNEVTLTWGHDPANNHKEDDSEVWTAKIGVNKKIGSESGDPLEGAGFVLRKDGTHDYYFLNASGIVEWVTLADDAEATITTAITDGTITQHTSLADGTVAPFTGLPNGTYQLVESTVPAGYNKTTIAALTINNGDVTLDNLAKTSTVINNAGTTLPSTGGIGTTIFYILGGLLVVGAAVILVARRRVHE